MEARLAELGVASWSAVPCDGAELLCSAVCGGAAVEGPCRLQRSMVLPGGTVRAGEDLRGTVVGDGFRWEVDL